MQIDTTTDLIDKGLQITPYSMTAYGAVVVILAIAVVFLWRKLAALEAMFVDMLKDGTEIFTKVAQRLEDQQNLSEKQGHILTGIEQLSDKMDRALQKLDK